MDNKIKAVVTGGCGFIGSHIAEKLAGKGYEVVVVDNLSSGKKENISHLAERVVLAEGDIRDEGFLEKAFRGAHVVFHEAALVSVPESEESPAECFDINVGGTIKVISRAQKEGVKKIVFASSCAVYGNEKRLPLAEFSATAPLSPYALSKILAENIMRECCARKEIGITALRYFNVFGPRQNPDSKYAAVVSKFVKDGAEKGVLSVEGDGMQTRDFVFVGDVAEANVRAAEAPTTGFHAINVCSGKEASVMDLAKNVSSLLGNVSIEHAPPRANDIMRSWGSGEKANDILGFTARTGLVEGLKVTIDSYLERKQK